MARLKVCPESGCDESVNALHGQLDDELTIRGKHGEYVPVYTQRRRAKGLFPGRIEAYTGARRKSRDQDCKLLSRIDDAQAGPCCASISIPCYSDGGHRELQSARRATGGKLSRELRVLTYIKDPSLSYTARTSWPLRQFHCFGPMHCEERAVVRAETAAGLRT